MKDGQVASVEENQAERLDRLLASRRGGETGGTGVPGAVDDPRQDDAAPPDLGPLVQLAADLRHLAPEASLAPARSRVWARLAPRLSRGQTWRLVLRPAYALAALALALSLGLGMTTAYASEAALPGDALYPLKRSLEQARLALSITAAGDAALLAGFADRRVGEIERLAALERWDEVEAAVADYPDLAGSLDDLQPAQVEGQLERHLEVLERVRRQAPEAAQAGLDRALERAAKGQQEVERRRHTPVPHPTPTPGARESRGPKKTPPGLERGGD